MKAVKKGKKPVYNAYNHHMNYCLEFVITDRKENTDLPGQETFQKSKTLVLPLCNYCMLY